MTRQAHPLRHALPALLLAGASWLPMQAATPRSLINEPPEDEEGEIIITLEGVPVQENPSDTITIFPFAEKMPEFPGGPMAMKKYLKQHFQYPPEALDLCLMGKVFVEFTILKNGKIQDVEVVRGVYPAVDNEAVRVVSSMPAWIPGEHYGKKVNVRYILPIDATPGYYQTDTISAFPADDGLLLDPIEEQPEYPGGPDSLLSFIYQNLQYPPQALKNGEEGRVIVQFVINRIGKTENAQVVRGVSPALDKEALRLVKAIPHDWKPGSQSGIPLAMKYTLPIVFNLPDTISQHDAK